MGVKVCGDPRALLDNLSFQLRDKSGREVKLLVMRGKEKSWELVEKIKERAYKKGSQPCSLMLF